MKAKGNELWTAKEQCALIDCLTSYLIILHMATLSYALEKMQNFGLCWVCSVFVTCEQGGTSIVLLCCTWLETNASFAVSSRRTAPFGCFLMVRKWAWKQSFWKWFPCPLDLYSCMWIYLLTSSNCSVYYYNTATLQSLKTLHHEYDNRQAW